MLSKIKWYWLIFADELVFTAKDLTFCKNEWDLDELYPWYSTSFWWKNLSDFIDFFESEYRLPGWDRKAFKKRLLVAAERLKDLEIIVNDYPEIIIRDYSREKVTVICKEE